MKVFFDTNVYVAEALLGETAERLIEATVGASWRLYACPYLLDECERVLTEKLGFSRRLAVLSRQRIVRRAALVEPGTSRHGVADDPNDSPILQAALSAGVDYLVTNDKHLLSLDPYESVRVVSMDQYRQLLGPVTDGEVARPPPLGVGEGQPLRMYANGSPSRAGRRRETSHLFVRAAAPANLFHGALTVD